MAKAKTAKETTHVRVLVPHGCKKTNISIDALDSYAREVAEKTWVKAAGRTILCRSAKLVEVGGEQCLQITIRPESYSWDVSAMQETRQEAE